MSESDANLVSGALEGDLAAYATLMARYRSDLGRYAFHMLGNRQDAEEALQDAFVRAFRSLAQCEQPERFAAWLFRILVNRCRSARTRRRRLTAGLVHQPAPDLPDHYAPTEAMAWREEIARALAVLQANQREAFLLRYVEGLSYEEMATLTGAGESALRMRVKRARDRMRELLRDVYVGGP